MGYIAAGAQGLLCGLYGLILFNRVHRGVSEVLALVVAILLALSLPGDWLAAHYMVIVTQGIVMGLYCLVRKPLQPAHRDRRLSLPRSRRV